MTAQSTTVIFADNYFTSLNLVRHLKKKNCRYTETARENRIGQPGLKNTKEMRKASVPRFDLDYIHVK